MQDTKLAISEFLALVEKRFKGYDLFLGFPVENSSAVNFFEEQGFECIEDDYNNTAFLDLINDIPNFKNLIRITRENYESFKTLLYASLADAKSKGSKTMTFFCEEKGEQAALECGFSCVGRYLCYKVHSYNIMQ